MPETVGSKDGDSSVQEPLIEGREALGKKEKNVEDLALDIFAGVTDRVSLEEEHIYAPPQPEERLDEARAKVKSMEKKIPGLLAARAQAAERREKAAAEMRSTKRAFDEVVEAKPATQRKGNEALIDQFVQERDEKAEVFKRSVRRHEAARGDLRDLDTNIHRVETAKEKLAVWETARKEVEKLAANPQTPEDLAKAQQKLQEASYDFCNFIDPQHYPTRLPSSQPFEDQGEVSDTISFQDTDIQDIKEEMGQSLDRVGVVLDKLNIQIAGLMARDPQVRAAREKLSRATEAETPTVKEELREAMLRAQCKQGIVDDENMSREYLKSSGSDSQRQRDPLEQALPQNQLARWKADMQAFMEMDPLNAQLESESIRKRALEAMDQSEKKIAYWREEGIIPYS